MHMPVVSIRPVGMYMHNGFMSMFMIMIISFKAVPVVVMLIMIMEVLVNKLFMPVLMNMALFDHQ